MNLGYHFLEVELIGPLSDLDREAERMAGIKETWVSTLGKQVDGFIYWDEKDFGETQGLGAWLWVLPSLPLIYNVAEDSFEIRKENTGLIETR